MKIDTLHDLAVAWRGLWRRRSFGALAAGTLALGIGAVTAISSVAWSVLVAPLPYRDPHRLVMVWSSWQGFPQTWVSWDEVELWREGVDAFAGIGLWYAPLAVTLGGAEEPERVQAAAVSHELLPLLAEPALGRHFLPEEDVPGAEPVAILGHELWQRRFAGDPAALGRPIEVDGESLRVVGVMPAGFRMPLDFGSGEPVRLWVPLASEPVSFAAVPGPAMAPNGGAHTFFAVARLAPGATPETADAELAALSARLQADGVYPLEWGFRARAVAIPEQVSGGLAPALRVLLAAGVLVLLVACANVTGLLLVRAEERQGEMGLRTALGAGRWRLARLAAAEAATLALVAGAGGALLAAGALALVRTYAPAELPRVGEVRVDAAALGLAVAASLATALVVGTVAAVAGSRLDPAVALRQAGRGVRRGGSGSGRAVLVVAEVALTVVAVAAAGLMARSVGNLLAIDPGFRSVGVLASEISVPSSRYPEDEDVNAFYAELVRRAGSLPGVEAAGLVRRLPLAAEMGTMGTAVEGYQPRPGEQVEAEWQVASGGYFRALGIRTLAGRLPDGRDEPASEPVLVVNQAFVSRFLAGRPPLGARVRVGGADAPWRTVVGVVADTRVNSLTAEVKPRFYAVHGQAGFAQQTMHLVVQGSRPPAALAADLRRAIRELDPRLATAELRPLADVVAASLARERFTLLLLGLFAAMATGLGAVGVYGLVATSVARRGQELGVRMALGARATDVLALVLRQGLLLTACGIGMGLALAAAGTRLLASLLVGVSPLDPPTLALASLVVAAAGLLAAARPAWRASRIDPATALAQE